MPPPALPHRVRRAGRLAPALVLALAAGACGSSGAAGPGAAGTTTPPAPAAVTVHISDLQFDPRRVEVAVGGSVTWVNDDVTAHMVMSTAPNVIQSPLIGQAGSYTRTFERAGEYPYYCNIHNSMKGEVVVR